MFKKWTTVFLFVIMGLMTSMTAEAGASAPDFTLRNLKGKQVSLSDFKGKVVLVNFWATWCAPCKTEMPHIQKMYTDFKDKGFEVLAISVDEARDISKIKPFIKRNRYTFQVLLDKQTKVVKVYNPDQTYPLNVLVDRNGEIAWSKGSYSPGEEKILRAKVEELIKQ